MSTYAIGDVQGCFNELQKLLTKINFDRIQDTLWFVGDIVNRGPDSLACLRFIKDLDNHAVLVLGNHDLHLIAIANDSQTQGQGDTLDDVLQASDCSELIEWLCQQPLLHHDTELGFTMTHAGIAPQWDLSTAKLLAHEVETILQGEQRNELLQSMYGNQPACWQDSLQGIERWRCIINFFTRMRFVHNSGCLELSNKQNINNGGDLLAWFKFPKRAMVKQNIIFGHWASLQGVTDTQHVYALDTGCVWGNILTAFCLESRECFSVPGNQS